MEELKDFLKNKKNLVSLLILAILIVAIPLGVKLVQETQIFKSRATGGPPIQFSGTGVTCTASECTTTSQTIDVEVLSPLGPHK